jgi:hypothetical protein
MQTAEAYQNDDNQDKSVNAHNLVNGIRLLDMLKRSELREIILYAIAANPKAILEAIGDVTKNEGLAGMTQIASVNLPTLKLPQRCVTVAVPSQFGNAPLETVWNQSDLNRIRHVVGARPGEIGNKIQGIKLIREIKGIGLADAKYTIEKMESMGLLY